MKYSIQDLVALHNHYSRMHKESSSQPEKDKYRAMLDKIENIINSITSSSL